MTEQLEGIQPQATWVDDAWREQTASADQPSRKVQRQTYEEQIYGLFQLNYYGIGATVLVALVVTSLLLMRGSAYAAYWLASMVLIATLRVVLCKRFFARTPSGEVLDRWARYASAGAGIQGLGWALLVPVGWATGNPYDFAGAVFVAAGFSFGAVATLASHIPAYLAFTLPIYITSTAIFLLERSMGGVLMAVVVGLFTVMTASSAVTAARLFRSSLLARHQNRALIRALSEENERVQVTLQSIGDGVFATDTEGRVTYINPYAESLIGWSLAEVRGQPLGEVLRLVNETSRRPVRDLVQRCLKQGGVVSPDGEIALLDRSGDREFSVEVTAAPIRDYDRDLIGVVIVAHDVTDLRKMARIMSYQANHDPLTGLVNRREFERRLRVTLDEVNSDGGAHYALCYMDLDQFKVVNDTCGHMAGDQLLTQLSGLLKQRVRESDTLARLGGDEFGILLKGCALEKAGDLAEEMRDVVREFRFTWEDKVFQVGASIGVAAIGPGGTPADVLAAADAACYVAKDQGRNRVHIFHPDDVEVNSRHGEMQLTSQIQSALDHDRFQLRYQKIVSLQHAEPRYHAEILLTMYTEDGKQLSPGLFLPAAERYSMMAAVDRGVVARAFQQLGRSSVLQDVEQLGINLSGQSLSNEGFLDFVVQALEQSGVDPHRICFEITETAVIANLSRAQSFMRELRGRGCKFALDDFGSGLSSFAYLRALPVDYLKIDGAFVRNMSQDAIDRAMVVSINDVGHVMGIETIAEFVEDAQTMELLRELGVDYAQGYGIHRPEPLP